MAAALLTMFLLEDAPCWADDLADYLTKTNVSLLTFGIQSLESDLRTKRAEACYTARCNELSPSISVNFLPPGSVLGPTLVAKADGAIVISEHDISTGEDSSLATEEGCKSYLRVLQPFSSLSDQPLASHARFFLNRREWPKLQKGVIDSVLLDRLTGIEKMMFVAVTEEHQWTKANGLIDRIVSVTCAAPYRSEKSEAVIVNEGHYPN